MTPAAVPAPGSEAARKAGCTCRVYESAWLDYLEQTMFAVMGDCPLHGADPLPDLRMRPRTDAETGGKP